MCAHHKGVMAAEAKNWIRKNHRRKFAMKGKTECISSLLKIVVKEEVCCKESNDDAISRMKVMSINTKKTSQQQIHLEAVTGVKSTNNT